MITIEYCQHAQAIADHKCEDRARDLIRSADALVQVSSENFIKAVRALIHEGVVSHKNVRFLFEGEFLFTNADGRLPVWPVGFCDTSIRFLERILSP